jgi:DedD protein
MVLDNEPKPSGKDIELRIPAADKVGEFVPGVAASAVAEALPLAASAVAASPAPVAASAVPTILAVAKTETAKPAAAATVAAPGKESAAGKAPESRGADQLAGVESFAAQVGAYSNADTAKQEMLKLKKWGFKAYTEKAGDKIRVRVGPYTERDKVEKVRQMLEKHGLQPVIVSAH